MATIRICLLLISVAVCCNATAQYFNQQPLYYATTGSNQQQQQQQQYFQEPIYVLQEQTAPAAAEVYQQPAATPSRSQYRQDIRQQQRQTYLAQPDQQLVRQQQYQQPQQQLVRQQQYQQPQQQQVYQQQSTRNQDYNPLSSAQQLNPVVAPRPRQAGGNGGSCGDGYPEADPSQCDKYYACENGEKVEKLCPDGLVFNPRVSRSRRNDPCFYPQEVECGSRSQLQPAQATDQCPRQFALFGTGDKVNCGQYISCGHGVAYTLPCPADLAFSDETGRCEWPDEVRTCDAAAYLQYSCPAPSAEGALDYYPDTNDCKKFFVCVDGLPRRISCGEDTVYNPATQTCDDPKNVPNCENYYANQRRNL